MCERVWEGVGVHVCVCAYECPRPYFPKHSLLAPTGLQTLSRLFTFVLNAFILMMLGSLSEGIGLGFHVNGFFPAFVGALIVTIVSFVLSMFVKPSSDRK